MKECTYRSTNGNIYGFTKKMKYDFIIEKVLGTIIILVKSVLCASTLHYLYTLEYPCTVSI